MRWIATFLSAEQRERLAERLRPLGDGVEETEPAGGGPSDAVLVVDGSEAGLAALVEQRRMASAAPAVIVVGAGEEPPALDGLHPAVLASPAWLEDEDELRRCFAQVAGLQAEGQRLRELERQLRESEEVRFQLQIRNEELERLLAAVDSDEPLTGLRGERSMARSVEEAFNLARRHQTPVACLLIGIDDYHELEERFGGFSDFITAQIAHRVKTCMRNTDLLARYRPGELLMLSPFATREGAGAVGERLREAVSTQHLEHEGRRLELSVSVGVATYTLEMQSSTELVEAAAAALDEARRGDGLRVL
jgi:diguanylate cyclase (GGDEF)-like protein